MMSRLVLMSSSGMYFGALRCQIDLFLSTVYSGHRQKRGNVGWEMMPSGWDKLPCCPLANATAVIVS